jgi:hypothetical protein
MVDGEISGSSGEDNVEGIHLSWSGELGEEEIWKWKWKIELVTDEKVEKTSGLNTATFKCLFRLLQ